MTLVLKETLPCCGGAIVVCLDPADGVALQRSFRPPSHWVRLSGQAITPSLLMDAQLPTAEQEAMANLFAGAIGLHQNPRVTAASACTRYAAEVIVFAS